MATEYERGYRDGITHAATLLENYIEKFKSAMTASAEEHLRACAEGLRTGVVAREIEGKGD